MEVKSVTTPAELEQAFAIRKIVFVQEQGVPETEEWDEFETSSKHYLLLSGEVPAGTARWRFTEPGKAKLERFAVLKEFRGLGGGALLVKAVLKDLPAGITAYLHAQVQVIGFYEGLGFMATGSEFDECGIMHRKMLR
jgi:predicted GNAT family N-acyltransferase